MARAIKRKHAFPTPAQTRHRRLAYTVNQNNRTIRPKRADELCARCLSIDLKSLGICNARVTTSKSAGIDIHPLGIVQSYMLSSRCQLCRMFAQLIPPKHNATQLGCVLRAFSAVSYHFPYRNNPRMQDTVIFSVAPLTTTRWPTKKASHFGLIYNTNTKEASTSPKMSGVAIDPLHADFETARNWIQYCKTHHNGYCKPQNPIEIHAIPGFKLIDCETRRIFSCSQQVKYVALSYVWGQSSARNSTRLLPKPAPRTIEDAIIVTKNMGFRHLWIDRYCISQVDATEKHEQIAKMDQIYAGAALTIVAAAGDNPNYGLPGVSTTSRHFQPSAIVGDQQLVSSLRPPRDVVLSSKWASRGWTFQEAKLSRRSLFFTDDQIFFECASMSCQETIRMPLKLAHQQWSGTMGREHDWVRIFPPNGPGRASADIFDVICDYALRHLSFPEDNLNGFLGILNSFKHSGSSRQSSSTQATFPETSSNCDQAKIYQIWGVPIIPVKDSAKLRSLTPDNSCRNLYWEGESSLAQSSVLPSSHTHKFCTNLLWKNESLLDRSPTLPSWSWTGWIFPCKISFAKSGWFGFNNRCEVEIRLRLQSNKTLSISRLLGEPHYENILDRNSQSLFIEGLVFDVKFTRTENTKFPLHPVVGKEADAYFWPTIKLDTEEKLSWFASRAWKAVIMMSTLASLYILVVEKKRGFYERVGLIEVTFSSVSFSENRAINQLNAYFHSLGDIRVETIELR